MIQVKLYYNEPLAIELIKKTFEASFSVNFDTDYWEWRFLNNPNHKKVYVAYIMVDDILAAYYAVSPMLMENKGELHKMALSNMTMTHPDHRGKGYFKLLATTLYQRLKEDGFIGVFGFANHNSHYGFKKYLNWQDLSALNIFSVTKDGFRPLREKKAIDLSKEELSEELINETSRLHTHTTDYCIHRDVKSLKWRLLKNPSNSYYCLKGKMNNNTEIMVVYKHYGEEIDVMEVFSSNLEETNYLIQSFEYLFESGASKINLWSNIHSLEHLALEKHGMQETSFNTYFGIIPFTNDTEIMDYRKWHFRFLDSDIF